MFKKPRFITFDVYDTLFTPKGSVANQYAEFMTRNGVTVTASQVESRFKDAFKAVTREYPNYGKDQGMEIQRWWFHILEQTFDGIPNVTERLFTGLYDYFNTDAPYALFPDSIDTLSELHNQDFTIGILSNGDPRMRKVLESTGLTPFVSTTATGLPFIFLSYETGYEKPSLNAFKAAESAIGGSTVGDSSGSRNSAGIIANTSASTGAAIAPSAAQSTGDRWHVGDDFIKDLEGSINAGWNGILIDRNGHHFEQAVLQANGTGYLSKDGTVFIPDQDASGPIRIFVRQLQSIPGLFDVSC